jgi:hypothetical protein
MRQVIELREYSAETNYLKNNNEENREPEEYRVPEQNREPEQEKGATPVPVPEEEQGTSRAEINREPKKKTERRTRYISMFTFVSAIFNMFRIRIRVDFVCWIQIRIQEEKITLKIEKKAGCSLLRGEDFSCSLDVLYGGLGICKLQFLIKKYNFFSAVIFLNFWLSKPWIWIRIRIETNADSKHWF